MLYNKHISEIIKDLTNNKLKDKITNIFFNLFGLTITDSLTHTDFYVTRETRIKIDNILMEHNFGNYKRNDGIQQVSENYFLEIINKFVKGEYYLNINVTKYYMAFGFSKYDPKEILELKNMNIYKNYCKCNEKYYDDFIKNQKYLYTTENPYGLMNL